MKTNRYRIMIALAFAVVTAIGMASASTGFLAPPAAAGDEVDSPFAEIHAFDGPVLDTAVWYTGGFRDSVGGERAALARLAIDFNNTNIAFANSGVNARLRLVHVAQTDTTSGSEDFERLVALGADIGIKLVASDEGSPTYRCGLASAVADVRANDAACVLTFAHEIGHVLNAEHCADDDPPWIFEAPSRAAEIPETPYMTVMCKGTSNSFVAERNRRVLLFSDSNVAEMNRNVEAVASARAFTGDPELPGCISAVASDYLIMCEGAALVQEAEGSPADVSSRSAGGDEDGRRFTTYRDPDRASSGGYFVASERAGDVIDFEFEVPRAGRYALWGRAMAKEGPSAVAVTSGAGRFEWQLPESAVWNDRVITSIDLPAGRTIVSFEALGAGAAFDVVRLQPFDRRPPLLSADDAARRQRAVELVAAFEEYATATGSYNIGGGFRDGGEGLVYRTDTADYPAGSIAQALIDAGIDADPAHPERLAKGEIMVFRCANRLGVFTANDGDISTRLATSTADQRWWQENDCADTPLRSGRSFFKLAVPARVEATRWPAWGANFPPLSAPG